MAQHAGGAQRVTRAAGLSVIAVALAAGAHATAGGGTPGIPVLVALTLVLTVPILALAGRRRGVLLTTALLGAGQWVMHQSFVLLAAPACTAAGPGIGHLGHAGHVVAVGPQAAAVTCAGASHAAAHAGHPDSSTMIALHVFATVLTAAVVTSGDRALSQLGAWLSRMVRLPGSASSVPWFAERVSPRGGPIDRPSLESGWRCTPLRGPPVPA